jgi:regulator of RNase E activity RraA
MTTNDKAPFARPAPIPEEILEVSSATAAGLLIKLGNMRTRVIQGARPLNPAQGRFAGRAFTVRFVPVREDLADRASVANPGNPHYGTIDRIPAGSVVVMDMMGDTTAGGLGDVMVARLKASGVVALVTDGGMRDGGALSRMDFPVYCAGVAPAPSMRALMAVDVQTPIACGGVMVMPGDVVLGDEDGVVVIPDHLIAEVARTGALQEKVEAWAKRQIEAGAPHVGLYPPTPESLERYRAWVVAGSPEQA